MMKNHSIMKHLSPSKLLSFSCSVVSDSLQAHGLQYARLPCPSPTPGAYSSSCPSSQWCHPTISSSVIPFSSSPQSFQASGTFLMSWLFASGGQSIGASASASVLPMNIKGWFPLGSTGWISLQSKGLSKLTKSKMKLTRVEESWDLRVGKDLNTHHIQLPTQGGTLLKDVPSGSPLNFLTLQDS